MTIVRCHCNAALAPDQRYCLRCGAATTVARASREHLLAAIDRPAAVVAESGALPNQRVALFPGRASDLSMRTATLAFAVVLGTAAWAGAQVAGPVTAAPRTVALAAAQQASAGPAAAAPTISTPATSGSLSTVPDLPAEADDTLPAATTEPTDELATPASTEPAADTPDSADNAADSAAEAGDAGDDTQAAGTPDDDAVAATTPILERVVVVVTPPVGYAAIADPAGPAPYLAGELASKGALLRGFHGVAPSAAASGVALLSGQGPNEATLAGCPTSSDLAPATIGDDEQAAGTGCRYPSDVFTVADLLGSTSRSWRAYAEDDAAASCAPTPDGAPASPTQPAVLAFRSLTDSAACASSVVSTDRLATDFASAKSAPTFSYVAIGGCNDGSACTPDDVGAVDASLREIVPAITGSAAYDDKTAVLILPSHAPQTSPAPDRSACCTDRPWITGDAATAGGGRTGAVVLSPLVRPGAVLDEALDQYDALRTISTALAVRPLGYAGRAEVKGFPRETWEQWTPSAADDPTATP